MNEILLQRVKRNNTEIRPCVVEELPDAHTVWLRVGVQHFCLGNVFDTKAEAEWMQAQLAHALATLIASNSGGTAGHEVGAESGQ